MLKYNFKNAPTFEEIKVEEYINKYIKELQRHFDVPNHKMREIILRVYKGLSPFKYIKNYINNFIKNSLDMIKSNYGKLLNRKT